jgi:hypothetical protein
LSFTGYKNKEAISSSDLVGIILLESNVAEHAMNLLNK